MRNNKKVVAAIEELYSWIDSRITSPNPCTVCGKCCDFESFGHKLFVTTPEMVYFAEKISPLKDMATEICPYNTDGKCTVYEYRFVSCRIFNCKSDHEAQNTLTEDALKELKDLCSSFHIPYRYIELKTALNNRREITDL